MPRLGLQFGKVYVTTTGTTWVSIHRPGNGSGIGNCADDCSDPDPIVKDDFVFFTAGYGTVVFVRQKREGEEPDRGNHLRPKTAEQTWWCHPDRRLPLCWLR